MFIMTSKRKLLLHHPSLQPWTQAMAHKSAIAEVMDTLDHTDLYQHNPLTWIFPRMHIQECQNNVHAHTDTWPNLLAPSQPIYFAHSEKRKPPPHNPKTTILHMQMCTNITLYITSPALAMLQIGVYGCLWWPFLALRLSIRLSHGQRGPSQLLVRTCMHLSVWCQLYGLVPRTW